MYTNFNDMTLDQLRDAKLEIDQQVEALRARKREIAKVENDRVVAQQTALITESLSDPQKAALFQSLKAEGFDSSI